MEDKDLLEIIKPLVADGMSVSEIHSVLKEKHGIDKVFRDLRMLVADCEEEREAAPRIEDKKEKLPKKEEGKIFVERHVNPVQNYLMSGDVCFATGDKGYWYVDKNGALGLDISEEISVDDLHDLKNELDKVFK